MHPPLSFADKSGKERVRLCLTKEAQATSVVSWVTQIKKRNEKNGEWGCVSFFHDSTSGDAGVMSKMRHMGIRGHKERSIIWPSMKPGRLDGPNYFREYQ